MSIFIIISFSLIVYITYRVYSWTASEWPSHSFNLPQLQVHRGYWVNGARENSLQSLRAAQRSGYLMAEFDVQMTKDFVPVVFHDKDLNRIYGINKRVFDLTLQELRQVADLPTLAEVFFSLERPPYLNVELKCPYVFRSTMEKKVVEVVRRCRVENQIIFSSFNPFTIYRLSKLIPHVPRALLATSEKEPGNYFIFRRRLLAPFIDLHMMNLDQRDVDAQLMKFAQKHSCPVAVWTVNDLAKAKQFKEMGVVSVISDQILPQDLYK